MYTFTEPTWSLDTATIIETRCNDSLQRVRTPYMITGFLTQVIRKIFISSATINDERLKGYLWKEDPRSSRIVINAEYHEDTALSGKTPGIYVVRGDISTRPMGINGSHTQSIPSGQVTKGVTKTSVILGGHNIVCVGETAAEAENIAHEVFLYLMEQNYAIHNIGGLGYFHVKGMSAAKQTEQKTDIYSVTIPVSWSYSHHWTIDKVAPILKEIGA
jgi:hypothetical protein